MVPVKTTVENVARVLVCLYTETPLLLVGPPGVGKTAVVQGCGKLMSNPPVRINMTANTSLDTLIGCYIPRHTSSGVVFQWHDGEMLKAWRKGRWILLDEINLASPEVLEELYVPNLRSHCSVFMHVSIAQTKNNIFHCFHSIVRTTGLNTLIQP